MKNKIILILICFTSFFSVLKAQNEDKIQVFLQGDLVSSYIWRGIYQTGVSIQPGFGLGVKGFSFTIWGSTDFDGYQVSEGLANKEIDLILAYIFRDCGLTISVADLWWAGQGANKYFNFNSNETAHHFEAGLSYTLPVETFPLSIAWYTMVAGQDKNKEEKQNYSSYLEFNYPFNLKMVDLNVTCGLVPYRSPQYYIKGFSVTNVALKGTKVIKITDLFSLPVFVQAIWNPRLEDAHLVFGMTLKP